MKFASLLLAAAGLSTATAQPTFDEVLSRIRHNVEVFETQLPDFVCAEKINSRTVAEKDGSVEKETVIQSTFSGRQNHSALSKLGGLSSAAEPDPGSFVVAFTTRNSKQKMREKNGTVSFQAAGRAWFDPASFEIIRLEERILAKGEEPGDALPITVEYRPVQIGENQFRLPVRVSASARRVVAGNSERGEYVAEYSDYRKYGASSTIRYPNLEPR
jgi:hypothetical protein